MIGTGQIQVELIKLLVKYNVLLRVLTFDQTNEAIMLGILGQFGRGIF